MTDASGQLSGAAMFRWLLAWGVLILLLSLAARVPLLHRIMYYLLVLMILLLVGTQYRWFANVLAPLNTLKAGS